MEITPTQFAQIEHCLPLQRGNVSLTNLQVLNAVLYVAEHGCKWRGLPRRFGNWHTIYTRMNRWAKSGVLDRAFKELQRTQVVQIKIDAVSLGSTSMEVHPDGTGAPRKRFASYRHVPWRMEHQDPPPAADAHTATAFSLSPGQAHDAPEGSRTGRAARTTGSASARAHGSRL
jgi:transposase